MVDLDLDLLRMDVDLGHDAPEMHAGHIGKYMLTMPNSLNFKAGLKNCSKATVFVTIGELKT